MYFSISLFIPGIRQSITSDSQLRQTVSYVRQSVTSDSLIWVCKIKNLLALVKIIENYPVCKKVVFPF